MAVATRDIGENAHLLVYPISLSPIYMTDT